MKYLFLLLLCNCQNYSQFKERININSTIHNEIKFNYELNNNYQYISVDIYNVQKYLKQGWEIQNCKYALVNNDNLIDQCFLVKEK